jgi:hypothetical protein
MYRRHIPREVEMTARRIVAAVVSIAIGVIASVAQGAGPVPELLVGGPGIAVAGGAHVVTTRVAGANTRVRLVRDRDGAVLRARVLPGKLGIPRVTYSGTIEGTWARGRRLLLSTSIYDSPTSTTFVVIDTRTLRTVRRIALDGAFAFDAVSPDGKRLYVTQHPSWPNGPIRYVVRSLSVVTGRLEPGAIVDKTEPGERMTGIPMARAWSRDGASAFTLYNGLESHAFVHALDTVKRSARCIDLPWRGDGQNGLERVRMSVDDAGVLTLSQPGVGVLAKIDTRLFAVTVLHDPL